MGYPQDLLSTRAVIRHGQFAIIPPNGLVNNVITGFEDCQISIVASPKLGASFVQYHLTVEPGGGNKKGFGGDGIETFLFCLEGQVSVKAYHEEKAEVLEEGGYIYCPPTERLCFENKGEQSAKIMLYKQRHIEAPGYKPWRVSGNVHQIEAYDYEGMANVKLKDILPIDLNFDMNMHILSFKATGSHPFVETHVQEHGAYILSGEGLYYLNNEWIPVKKGDFIWFGPYTPQAVYAVGREDLTYIYSKDCNRDVVI